jgi:hypothetical protein
MHQAKGLGENDTGGRKKERGLSMVAFIKFLCSRFTENGDCLALYQFGTAQHNSEFIKCRHIY